MSGQTASASQGARAALLLSSWGRPRFASEPVSQTIARLQGEYSKIAAEIEVWDRFGDAARVSSLEATASDILDYLDVLYPLEKQTEFSHARDADHYVYLTRERGGPSKGTIDYDGIKARFDLAEEIEKDVPLRWVAGARKGLCPFHEEKTPSFVVYDDHYYCFGCGVNGTVVDWLIHKGISLESL